MKAKTRMEREALPFYFLLNKSCRLAYFLFMLDEQSC